VEPGGARFFLLFDVVGTPAPTPRPRSATGRKGVYVPKTAHEWKRAVRAQATRELAQQHLATQLLGRAHCLGALRVDVLFRMPRPKAHWRTGQHVGMLKTSAPVFHTSKPDKDNLEKAVLDALGEFDGDPPLVWVDDAQVVDGRTTKRYTRMGEDPGATVAIYELQR
jgi:Holliday junction resolvase RusA-like endonuclease